MRILHLATDDKFIDHAIYLFEEVFPGCNEVIIFAKTVNLMYVKTEPKKVIRSKSIFIREPKISSTEYCNYNVIVFHSLSSLIYPEIYNVPKHIPTVWVGWGYDYYDLIGASENLLLPETRKIFEHNQINVAIKYAGKFVRRSFQMLGLMRNKIQAIENMTLFAPVLPNEYNLVRESYNWKKFPVYGSWNYGSIEGLVKGFEGEQVDGSAILVGNSATYTCNHLDAFNFLNKIELHGRKIITPLSYGDEEYKKSILEVGSQIFGSNFIPLSEYISLRDYISTIKKCTNVIMNHKRQQALGNIVIMLALGARVFVRKENPIYYFLIDMGLVISSVQDMENNPSLLDKPLSQEERDKNRRLVYVYWSQERSIQRTKSLIESAIKIKKNEFSSL